MSQSEPQILEAQPLVRALGLREIWAIGVGAVVGDGIFMLMGDAAQMAGPMALISYFAAGLFLLCIMVSMGEMAVGMPDAGSLWVWTRRFMGDLAGFVSGVSYAAGWVIAGGSVGLAIGFVSHWFIPLSSTPETSYVLWSLIWVTVFAIVNYLGVIMASRTQLIMVLVLVGTMVVFALVGLFGGRFDPANYVPFNPGGWGMFFPTLAYGTYAYMGALTLTTAGSEAKNPSDLPRGLVYASITFLVVYTLAMAAMFGLASYEQMSVVESPFTTAAQVAFGPAAATILNMAAWLAAATCLIGGTMYAAPRLLYSMGRSHILPRVFSHVNQHRVPGFATVLVWVISVVLVLVGSKNPDIVYVTLSLLLVFCWAVTWTLGMISSVLYRSRYPQEIRGLPWKQPLYPLFPIIGFIGVAIIMYGTFKGAEMAILYGVIFVAALAIYYYAYGKQHVDKAPEY